MPFTNNHKPNPKQPYQKDMAPSHLPSTINHNPPYQNPMTVPGRIEFLFRSFFLGTSSFTAYTSGSEKNKNEHHEKSTAHARSHIYHCMNTDTSSRQSSIEALIYQCLDVLVFIIAIIITVYRYWSGSMDNDAHSPNSTPNHNHNHNHNHKCNYTTAPVECVHDSTVKKQSQRKKHSSSQDLRQKRTQAWTETLSQKQAQHSQYPYSEPILVYSPSIPDSYTTSYGSLQAKHDSYHPVHKDPPPYSKEIQAKHQALLELECEPSPKYQIQSSERVPRSYYYSSLPTHTTALKLLRANQQTEDRIARITRGLYRLIQEGQAALTSRVEFNEVEALAIAGEDIRS
ncbi:hypothetical protein BDF14DRAFT_1880786 [Spinellus fusiger]|nr:hypothetical protein BDF14DRAFT_1880786 [Spinellus fusiger]